MGWGVVAAIAGSTIASSILGKKSSDSSAKAAQEASDRAAQVQWDMYTQSREDLAPWREAGEYGLTSLIGETTYGLPAPNKEDFYFTPETEPSSVTQEPYLNTFPGSQDTRWEATAKPPTEVFDQAAYDAAMERYYASSQKTPGLLTEGPGEFTESPGYEWALSQGVNALDRSATSRGRLRSGAHEKALLQYGQGLALQDYDNFLNRYYQSLNPYFSLANLGQVSAGQTSQIGATTGAGIASNYLSTGQQVGQARASGYANTANALTSATQNYLTYNALNRGNAPINYTPEFSWYNQ